MELKDYTTEELRDKIKRRNELARETKNQEPRCRDCKRLTNALQTVGQGYIYVE
jgi:hypothetical protein